MCVRVHECVCVHLQQVKRAQVNLSLDPLGEVRHIGVDAGAQDLRETHRPPGGQTVQRPATVVLLADQRSAAVTL